MSATTLVDLRAAIISARAKTGYGSSALEVGAYADLITDMFDLPVEHAWEALNLMARGQLAIPGDSATIRARLTEGN
jgi:hypothetical protein